jgi:hypothetical protein
MMRIVQKSLLYFAIVFAAGFVLGSLRVIWLLPALGERYAELAEMPVMLLVIYFAARRVVSGSAASLEPREFLLIGALALALLLLFEFTLVLGLRGLTLTQYFESRDPVSGSAYLISLCVYGLAPWLLARKYHAQR